VSTKVDADVLGRLFSHMLLLEALPTEAQVVAFLQAVLADVPGVLECRVHLGERETDDVPAAWASLDWAIPVETRERRYGGFYLRTDESGSLDPYRPFIVNLASAVAVLCENRRRRDRLEAALGEVRASEARFSAMFEQAPIGMALIEAGSGGFLHVNAGFALTVGRGSEEVQRMDWSALAHPDAHAPDLAALTAAAAAEATAGGHRAAKTDVMLRRADGTPVLVVLTVARMQADDGSSQFLCMVEDVTRQREAERARQAAENALAALNTDLELRVAERTEELTRANEELEAFAYSISHDLRTPLRAIDGFSHIVLDDSADVLSEQARENLTRVRAAAQRMGMLIDDLLMLARIGRLEIDWELVDLSAVAAAVTARLREADPERHVQVTIEPGCVWPADPRLIESLLENLLGNAWKFTSRNDDAHIWFGSLHHGGTTAFYVKDDGVGFDPEYAEKLFLPFERLHRQDQFPGSGVGLAIVRRIAARLGGLCWAESPPGDGATFFFTLAEPEPRAGAGVATGVDSPRSL